MTSRRSIPGVDRLIFSFRLFYPPLPFSDSDLPHVSLTWSNPGHTPGTTGLSVSLLPPPEGGGLLFEAQPGPNHLK